MYQERWKRTLERRAHNRHRRLGSSPWWAARSSWRPGRAASIHHDVRMGRRSAEQPADVPLWETEAAADPRSAAPWNDEGPSAGTPEGQA